VLFGVISVWLTVRENIWCWPTGLVNVLLFVVVFWQAKLYADMGLQVVYAILSVYGWYEWLYGGKGRGERAVSRTPRFVLVPLLLAGLLGLVGLGLFLRRATDAALPFWDAGTTSFSLVAQWMLTKKWLENWLIWIVVDVIYVGMYLFKQLYPTAGLYLVFLVLACLGFQAWTKALGAAPRG
jgi:nicotinamide mononucleotide transporter